jgi:hypothetical protein
MTLDWQAAMTNINPFIGSVLQSTHVQRLQAADKDRQIRRQQDLEKNAALESDKLEHQVESAEQLNPIHDDDSTNPRRRPRNSQPHKQSSDPKDSGGSHLDVTA